MVELIDGVANVVPVPRAVPPVAAANQDKLPEVVVAPKETVPAPHLLAGVVVGAAGVALTVI